MVKVNGIGYKLTQWTDVNVSLGSRSDGVCYDSIYDFPNNLTLYVDTCNGRHARYIYSRTM